MFTRTYLHTFITYLHLSLSTLYVYISIFISFYNHLSCLNAPVLAVLIIVRSIDLLNIILHMY
jgi:hypothetical protein